MEKRYVIVAEESPLDDSYEDRYKEKNIINYKNYYWIYTDSLTEEEFIMIVHTIPEWFYYLIGWYAIIDLKTNKILSEEEEQELYQRNKTVNKKMADDELEKKFHYNE